MRSFGNSLQQMKEDETVGTCSTRGRKEKCMKNFSRKTSKEEIISETCLYGRITLKWIFKEQDIRM
jgi:hypothetical protein